MTRLFCFLLFLAFPFNSFSQETNDKIIYLDENYVKVDEGKHVFYQIIRDFYLEKDRYVVEEYYKSGHLKMSGISSQNVNFKYIGLVTRYFESDTILSKTIYKDGQLEGNYFSWHPNGHKAVEAIFILDPNSKHKEVIQKIHQFWNESGVQKVTNGNGIYDEIYSGFYASGEIKNGLKNGTWTGFDKMMNISFSEKYSDGKFISGVTTDENAIEYSYNEIRQRPSPKKGIQHFYNFVGKKFKLSKNFNASGKIILSFIVDKMGAIDKIEILKGIDPKLDQEAVRVLNLYRDWLPGKYRGIDVSVSYSLPITIKQD